MTYYIAFIYDNFEERYVDYSMLFTNKEDCEHSAIRICEDTRAEYEEDDECRFQYDIKELEVVK